MHGNVQMIAIRRSTLTRVTVAALVLAALGIGYAVGLAISPTAPSTSAAKVVTEASESSHGTTATMSSSVAGSARTATVVSCRRHARPQVRPTRIDIGCSGDVLMSAVTWSSWGTESGNGSGTLTLRSCQPTCAAGTVTSSPAFVVVSDPQGGVYQHVLITPPTGSLAPQASSDPGSGWGSG